MAINSVSSSRLVHMGNNDIHLPTEIIIHIMSYLTGSDRMAAGLVCRQWHEASLDTQFVEKQSLILGRSGTGDNLHKVLHILRHSNRPFYHFVFKQIELRRMTAFWEQFGANMRSLILVSCDLGERTLVDILKSCDRLRTLHINGCRECLMSGRLLDNENDVKLLSDKFRNLNELSLASNRYLSDALFNRLVAICPNLVSLSLMGCQISFHSGLYKKFYPNNSSVAQASESVLTFHNILEYLTKQASRLKHLSFGYTLIDGTALATMSELPELDLQSLKLHACDQLTNVGIRSLTEHQRNLKVLDVSFCTRVTDASLLSICKNLCSLEVLIIRRCRAVTDHGIKLIRHLQNLKELDISECEQLTSECITNGLCTSEPLDSIALSSENSENLENRNPNVNNAVLDSSGERPTNANLEKFQANALNLDEKSISMIAKSYPRLRHLDLGYCFSAVTDVTAQMIFKELVHLRQLKISHCDRVSDVGLTGMGVGNREIMEKALINNYEMIQPKLRISLRSRAEEEIVRDAKRKQDVMKMCEDLSAILENKSSSGFSLARLKGLRELDLSGCNRITDVSLTYAFNFPELAILDLSMCQQVSHVGLDFLTRNNRAIEELNLSQCHNVTDTGISYVTERLHRLRRLYLKGCSQLTDHSLDSVKINCTSLQYLDVRACRGMSAASIENFVNIHVDYSADIEDTSTQYKPPSAPPMRR